MTIPLARTVRKLKQAFSRRLPQRRDDSGLTTLEWLLIVAAVAGLAALAVVLVTNVVNDTSEQIAGNNARLVSAKIAAEAINEKGSTAVLVGDIAEAVKDATDLQSDLANQCRRLEITYGNALTDSSMKVDWTSQTIVKASFTTATLQTALRAQFTQDYDDATSIRCRIIDKS